VGSAAIGVSGTTGRPSRPGRRRYGCYGSTRRQPVGTGRLARRISNTAGVIAGERLRPMSLR